MSYVPQSTPPAHPHAVAPAAGEPRRSRSALFVGLAVVALCALLSGGFLVLRAGRSVDAAAAISATSAASVAPVATTGLADAAVAGAGTTTPVTGTQGNGGESNGGLSTSPSTGAGNAASTPAGGKGVTPTNGGGNATPAPKPAPTVPPTTAPAAPAPVITSFTTPDSIDCHNDDSPMFSASWTTTNAVKTTIAIDGPGIYKTYGPNASDSLPFNCSSAHTFKLTAFGQDGHTVSKTITLQPRNVRPPAAPDTDQ